MCHRGVRRKPGRNHRFKSLSQQNVDCLFFALAAEKIAAQRGQQRQQAIGCHFIVYPLLMCRMVFNASPQFDTADPCIAQHSSRVFYSKQIKQQIGRQIAARSNHPFCERGNLRCAPDRAIELRHSIRRRIDSERRSVGSTQKTIAHVERIAETQAALIHGAKDGEQHCDFDGAGSVKPAVAAQRKSKTALEVVQCHCARASLTLSSQSLQFPA